ncbi:acyl-CoA dehydrogenase family protein [Flavobacteriaceae bacterium]|nr:acyl-CoA dehydrogenase family protein [Flavobacteriaceae bacterium]|tara:strand:- start:2052 stop:3248 length:1197 start_codon:yes stop_codon:yes gene_type:complete
METKVNVDLTSFRTETRKWLEDNCPLSMREPTKDPSQLYWGGRNGEFSSNDQKIWFDRMLEKKWIVPYWEAKYGGGGLSSEENNILNQEMGRLGCRKPHYNFGISMLGPAMLKFATEEQKLHYLPEIVEGKIRWCQGYSEPNAGSDLANLQTKAEDKGDHFLVTGSKVWTSYAEKADWIFCLVRTDSSSSKHTGISFLLIDMASEGVSTRPIKLISGKSPFCETFLDSVKVPKKNLVGTLNDGWTIAKYLLTHERQMIGGVGETDKKEFIRKEAIDQISKTNGILTDTVLRSKISEFEMNEEIFDLTIQRTMDEEKSGNNSGAASSFFKYYGTELNIQREELRLSINGFNSSEWNSKESENGKQARFFCRTKGNSIEGGTHEIQLNIIAKRILGLPSK